MSLTEKKKSHIHIDVYFELQVITGYNAFPGSKVWSQKQETNYFTIYFQLPPLSLTFHTPAQPSSKLAITIFIKMCPQTELGNATNCIK